MTEAISSATTYKKYHKDHKITHRASLRRKAPPPTVSTMPVQPSVVKMRETALVLPLKVPFPAKQRPVTTADR